MTAHRWERIESMLSNSQRVRDDLADAVGKLDSYIDLLRTELARRDTRSMKGVIGDEPRG
ncbi:MAG TPA: hypothetical protein VFX53_17160 [Pedococcus sp.]|nr:hypothetical protein [Pedococcus sp.]